MGIILKISEDTGTKDIKSFVKDVNDGFDINNWQLLPKSGPKEFMTLLFDCKITIDLPLKEASSIIDNMLETSIFNGWDDIVLNINKSFNFNSKIWQKILLAREKEYKRFLKLSDNPALDLGISLISQRNELVDSLLKKHKNLFNQSDNFLKISASIGNYDYIKMFLPYASKKAIDEAINIAINNNRYTALKSFIDNANICKETIDYNKIFSLCIEKEKYGLAKIVLNKSDSRLDFLNSNISMDSKIKTILFLVQDWSKEELIKIVKKYPNNPTLNNHEVFKALHRLALINDNIKDIADKKTLKSRLNKI